MLLETWRKLESLLMLHQLCEPDLQTQPWFYGGDAKRNYEPWDARRSLYFLKYSTRQPYGLVSKIFFFRPTYILRKSNARHCAIALAGRDGGCLKLEIQLEIHFR